MGAVITKSGQTQILAGLTRLVISGQDSFQSTGNDGWTKIRRHVWTWSDGLVQYGACISRKFTVAATYTLTLATEFKDGSTPSTAPTTVVVAATPTFANFTKYVSSTTGNDAFDGNSAAFPYKTLQKAIDVWTSFRDASSTGFAWGQVLLKSSDSIPFAGSAGFDFGPLFVSTYAGAARATIAFTSAVDGVGFTLCRGGHDNLYDNPIFWSGINLTFNANHRTSDDTETLVSLTHVATQLENSIVTNAGVLMSVNGGATPHGGTLYGCDISNSYRNGVFFSAQFAGIDSCNIHDNGHINDRDNEIYASAGCAHSYVSNTTLSQLVNTTTSGGLNGSGINKLYISDLIVNGCRTAFGPGGNEVPPGEVTQDVICDRLTGIDINGVGIYPNYLNRVSIRNPRLFRCKGPVIRFQSYHTNQKIDSFEVLAPSFSLCTDGISAEADGDQADGLSTNVVIEDMVLTMPSSGTGITDHLFFMMKSAASLAGFTLKNCQYYRVGDTAASTTFASVGGYSGGAIISFTDWQTNLSHEPGSQYGDPIFVDPNTDLHLQTGSPCIDHGFDTGVGFDFDGIVRPQGAAYDIGAHESTISSGGKNTFRQYGQTFQVGTAEIGFESQAAADAGARQAIADNPICGVNNQPWVYPGTDNSQPNHLFVRRFNRWERGNNPPILLWFIQAGQDDGTEAHETGIPGYATAMGYDATLQAIMTRYATDVGDASIASKSSHYEICWSKKQKALGLPPQLDPIVVVMVIPGPMTSTIKGGTNFVSLDPIYCETDTKVVTTGGTGNIPVPPIWCETSTTTMSVNYGTGTQIVQVKKIWANHRIFQNMTIRSPGGNINSPLDTTFCEAVTLAMDFMVQGGNQGVTLQTIFCESDIVDMDSHVSSTTTAVPLQPIWCEQGVFSVMPYLQVSTITFVPMSRIYCESKTTGPILNAGGSLHVGLQTIWCETFPLTMSITNNGAIAISMQAIWCESFLGDMSRTEIDPQIINLVPIHSEVFLFPMDDATLATPQAVSTGEISGDVEFEEDF